jgi:hypothetical protein
MRILFLMVLFCSMGIHLLWQVPQICGGHITGKHRQRTRMNEVLLLAY